MSKFFMYVAVACSIFTFAFLCRTIGYEQGSNDRQIEVDLLNAQLDVFKTSHTFKKKKSICAVKDTKSSGNE